MRNLSKGESKETHFFRDHVKRFSSVSPAEVVDKLIFPPRASTFRLDGAAFFFVTGPILL